MGSTVASQSGAASSARESHSTRFAVSRTLSPCSRTEAMVNSALNVPNVSRTRHACAK
jgi:hypothetical protein